MKENSKNKELRENRKQDKRENETYRIKKKKRIIVIK